MVRVAIGDHHLGDVSVACARRHCPCRHADYSIPVRVLDSCSEGYTAYCMTGSFKILVGPEQIAVHHCLTVLRIALYRLQVDSAS